MEKIFNFPRPSALTPACVQSAQPVAVHAYAAAQPAGLPLVPQHPAAQVQRPPAQSDVQWLLATELGTAPASKIRTTDAAGATNAERNASTTVAKAKAVTTASTTENKGNNGTTSAKGAGMAKSLRHNSGGVPPRGRPV